MKNETTVTKKLTPAQAYAAQVRADRRAAAVERQGSTIAADNARLNELFKREEVAKVVNVKKTQKATKKVRWTAAELDYLVDRYLAHFNKADGSVDYVAIGAEFAAKFTQRGTTGVQMAVCQIRGLDTWVVGEGLSDTSQALIDKLYAVDPERFPGGASRQDKVMTALDNLLAELR
jgi:hypothetical protein